MNENTKFDILENGDVVLRTEGVLKLTLEKALIDKIIEGVNKHQSHNSKLCTHKTGSNMIAIESLSNNVVHCSVCNKSFELLTEISKEDITRDNIYDIVNSILFYHLDITNVELGLLSVYLKKDFFTDTFTDSILTMFRVAKESFEKYERMTSLDNMNDSLELPNYNKMMQAYLNPQMGPYNNSQFNRPIIRMINPYLDNK